MAHRSDLHRSRFATTRWSLVRAAAGPRAGPAVVAARAALQQLCQMYWPPVYAFLRRRGDDPQTAADYAQGFFAHFLEREGFGRADPIRGKFRTYLLTSLRNFLANERERDLAAKRGAGKVVTCDWTNAEAAYRCESRDELTPDRVFDRRWAVTLLEAVLAELRAEWSAAGRGPTFDRLQAFLAAREAGDSYRSAAHDLGTSEEAVKAAVYRLRRRYRDRLREVVADSVESEGQVEGEIRDLFAALGE